MMPKPQLRRADLVAGSFFLLLGIVVMVASLRMPMSGTYGGRPIYWYTSPGFFPLLVGFLFVLFSSGVLWRAIADGGHRDFFRHVRAGLKNVAHSRPAWRTAGIWGLIGGYIGLLSLHPFGGLSATLEGFAWLYSPWSRFLLEPEGINYVLSSFLFLGGFMLAFYRPGGGSLRGRHVTGVLVLAVVISWAVGWTFTERLYTPLPWLD